MNCPKCVIPLSMSDRSGVEIDFCPQCRGVWLDRGELDKIIERSASFQPAIGADAPPPGQRPAAAPPLMPPQQPYHDEDKHRRRDYHDEEDDYRHSQRGSQKKKKGFLGDLFDF